ncbi:MAG: hypothetical protein ACK50J_30530, partial [Planctomyces sp.]
HAGAAGSSAEGTEIEVVSESGLALAESQKSLSESQKSQRMVTSMGASPGSVASSGKNTVNHPAGTVIMLPSPSYNACVPLAMPVLWV